MPLAVDKGRARLTSECDGGASGHGRSQVSGGGALRRFPYVTQTGLEPIIVLPQPLKCGDYKRAPPHPTRGMFLKAFAP